MFKSRSSLVLAAALAGIGGLVMAPVNASQVERATVAAPRAAGRAILPVRSGGFGSKASARRAGFGWTDRHARRVAVKKRNVLRHRARNRGRA